MDGSSSVLTHMRGQSNCTEIVAVCIKVSEESQQTTKELNAPPTCCIEEGLNLVYRFLEPFDEHDFPSFIKELNEQLFFFDLALKTCLSPDRGVKHLGLVCLPCIHATGDAVLLLYLPTHTNRLTPTVMKSRSWQQLYNQMSSRMSNVWYVPF
jgi:hypothetical protein